VLLAQTGQRVVLVDADLRRPRLHKVFGYDGSRGLTSALLGQPVLDLLFPVALGAGHLEVLAAGPIPTNPSETLGSERMRVLINELTKMFDTVVIDSAPVLPVTDAVVAARLADAVVLVSLASQSTDRQMREAIGLMGRANAPLVGTVLNGVDPDRDPYGNGYGYGYGYTAHTADTSEQATQRFKKRR
jgi:polysaccharide biosynthesis transport protein